nr:protein DETOXIFICATION 54 [Ipomoea batatas]
MGVPGVAVAVVLTNLQMMVLMMGAGGAELCGVSVSRVVWYKIVTVLASYLPNPRLAVLRPRGLLFKTTSLMYTVPIALAGCVSDRAACAISVIYAVLCCTDWEAEALKAKKLTVVEMGQCAVEIKHEESVTLVSNNTSPQSLLLDKGVALVSNTGVNDRVDTLGYHYVPNNEGTNGEIESEGVVILEQKRKRMDTDCGFQGEGEAGSSPMIVEDSISDSEISMDGATPEGEYPDPDSEVPFINEDPVNAHALCPNGNNDSGISRDFLNTGFRSTAELRSTKRKVLTALFKPLRVGAYDMHNQIVSHTEPICFGYAVKLRLWRAEHDISARSMTVTGSTVRNTADRMHSLRPYTQRVLDRRSVEDSYTNKGNHTQRKLDLGQRISGGIARAISNNYESGDVDTLSIVSNSQL